jgi:hypothetical protein
VSWIAVSQETVQPWASGVAGWAVEIENFAKSFEKVGLAKGHMAIHPSVGIGSWMGFDKLLEPGFWNPEPKDFTGLKKISSGSPDAMKMSRCPMTAHEWDTFVGHLARVLKFETKPTFNNINARWFNTRTWKVSRDSGTIFAFLWVLDDTSKSGF